MKSVLITGSSTGIGAACALELDARGMQVFAGVRKSEDGERLRGKASERLVPVIVDVTDDESIRGAVASVTGVLSGERSLDGLVNNAGISVSGPLEFVFLADIRRQFDVNLFGHIAVTQAFLPLVISGRLAAPLMGPYPMSKFALEAFSGSLRRELQPWGIHVSRVSPGAVDTPIWDKALGAEEERTTALTDEARSLYGELMEAMRTSAVQMSRGAVSTDEVVKVVHHALVSRRPQSRYLVGPDAKVAGRLVRFLPDRWIDFLSARASADARARRRVQETLGRRRSRSSYRGKSEGVGGSGVGPKSFPARTAGMWPACTAHMMASARVSSSGGLGPTSRSACESSVGGRS